MIQVRKLLTVELTFLGPRIVFAEYGLAVVAAAAVGVLSLRAGFIPGHPGWQILLGVYLLLLALTYAVLLGQAIAMAGHGNACAEIGDDLNDTRTMFRKYRRQSLWLLVPLVVPIRAVMESQKSR